MDPTSELKTAKAVRLDAETVKASVPPGAAGIAANETAGAVASAAPLPGPLREAFAEDPLSFCGFRVQPVTATHVGFLVRRKSPFLGALILGSAAAGVDDPEEKAKLRKQAEEIPIADEDLFFVLFIFSLTPAQLRGLGAGSQLSAVQELMDGFAPVTQGMLAQFLSAHYFASFKTAIEHQAAESEGKKKSFSTASTRTDSAGS